MNPWCIAFIALQKKQCKGFNTAVVQGEDNFSRALSCFVFPNTHEYSNRREPIEQLVVGPVRRQVRVARHREYELVRRTASYERVEVRTNCQAGRMLQVIFITVQNSKLKLTGIRYFIQLNLNSNRKFRQLVTTLRHHYEVTILIYLSEFK